LSDIAMRVEPTDRLKELPLAAILVPDSLLAAGNIEPSFQTPPGWPRIGMLA